MSQHHEHGDHHGCPIRPTACIESIDEMDFKKGIWGAALDCDLDRIERLAMQGVDVKDNAGYTALHYASRNGNLEVCHRLLDFGADPNARTRAGQTTPLHRAALAGLTDVVKLLLNYQADPSLRDSDGQTALHRAAIANRLDLAEILLKVYPEAIKIQDNKGRLPIDLVKEWHGYLSKVFILFENYSAIKH